MKKLKVGDQAPNFSLKDKEGKSYQLSQFLGKGVVLYFYPKNNTPTCTKEACAFRDNYEVFKSMGAEVIGISSDSADSHNEFTQKLNLPFILLSDRGGEVRSLYGATQLFGLIPERKTFVIDKNGKIAFIFNDLFDGEKHISKSIEIIKSIN